MVRIAVMNANKVTIEKNTLIIRIIEFKLSEAVLETEYAIAETGREAFNAESNSDV